MQTLIDFPVPNARNTDPETSHDAAEDASFKASKHRLLALKALFTYGAMTDYELAARTGLQQNSIGKRRKDCQDAGLVTVLMDVNGGKVRRPAPSGSSALVWTLTATGQDYVLKLRRDGLL